VKTQELLREKDARREASEKQLKEHHDSTEKLYSKMVEQKELETQRLVELTNAHGKTLDSYVQKQLEQPNLFLQLQQHQFMQQQQLQQQLQWPGMPGNYPPAYRPQLQQLEGHAQVQTREVSMIATSPSRPVYQAATSHLVGAVPAFNAAAEPAMPQAQSPQAGAPTADDEAVAAHVTELVRRMKIPDMAAVREVQRLMQSNDPAHQPYKTLLKLMVA
jgi:hypothetical protein